MEKLITYDIFSYESIAQALSNKNRLKILNLLKDGEMNINEIAKELNMPMPSVTVNIQKLEESGLIACKSKSGKHGKQKICSLKYKEITLRFFEENSNQEPERQDHEEASLPKILETTPKLIENVFNLALGSFIDNTVVPECGMATLEDFIEKPNLTTPFISKEKLNSEILWFNEGFVTYDVPLELDKKYLESIHISFEACSEHMYFNKNWPSDITLWLNDYELGAHTSEGYFGDKGISTPNWWPLDKPQHGELINFEINNTGTYINGNIINSFHIKNISSLDSFLQIKIGIKQNAKNSRGLMIFGENFGNYKQGIMVKVKLLDHS